MEDSSTSAVMIDEIYEFSAPRFYDFVNGETDEDARIAQLWFDTALSYAPSPSMLRIKAGRSVRLSSQCDFGDAQQTAKAPELLDSATALSESQNLPSKLEASIPPTEMKENINPNNSIENPKETLTHQICDLDVKDIKDSAICSSQDVSTPKPSTLVEKGCQPPSTVSKRQQTAKKIATALKNPSHSKYVKPASIRRDVSNMKSSLGTPNLVQENQAVKRQKLDNGKTRQILNIKPPSLPHKTRPAAAANVSKLASSTTVTSKENRKMYVRETTAPYVSMAEMVHKFQSSTRDMALRPNLLSQGKPQLTLTRPKEPEFVTSQRVRLVKLKSSAELEEEMMAKMPKFKARPLNKKILEAPSLPPLPKRQPQKPEFQEFHLETMERANKSLEVSSVVSSESGHQKTQWKPNHLTEPKTPVLQTSLRARPTNVKSSVEIEEEELDKIPKFKARPLNKKIFESKGELGLFCNTKKQVTVPKEFHFAIDERIPPPASSVSDLFDKLSLDSELNHEKQLPRITRPNPFNLHTEERGAEKERRLISELMQKQLEEERARVPKAKPYPYTTDFPVVPPRPDPKECTRPEPFQLESLVRHEDELRREMEERQKKEREEARMRAFKAQPVLKEDPIPLPEKERKPLTQVQEFNLHVEHRAVDRAEFDQKIKEKDLKYKRYREEAEAEKQMEEEKALKQLRRTLIPHARPVPNFANPFMPQKSCKEPTKAKSPKLRVLRRKERKASAGSELQAAYSASAGLMR
ncbi:protein TPX2 isoform X2 [Silene latifolia]|uniref:protein TPX2 isoform X2 n=1 Tax=Silene latifolia TaxID=37657 RepID=UPI003D7891F3